MLRDSIIYSAVRNFTVCNCHNLKFYSEVHCFDSGSHGCKLTVCQFTQPKSHGKFKVGIFTVGRADCNLQTVNFTVNFTILQKTEWFDSRITYVRRFCRIGPLQFCCRFPWLKATGRELRSRPLALTFGIYQSEPRSCHAVHAMPCTRTNHAEGSVRNCTF